MPALRGIEPTSSAQLVPSNASLEVGGGDDALEKRVRLVLQLHDQALERLHRRLDLEQAQHDRLVEPEELTRGDPVDQGVPDLTGCARDGDVER